MVVGPGVGESVRTGSCETGTVSPASPLRLTRLCVGTSGHCPGDGSCLLFLTRFGGRQIGSRLPPARARRGRSSLKTVHRTFFRALITPRQARKAPAQAVAPRFPDHSTLPNISCPPACASRQGTGQPSPGQMPCRCRVCLVGVDLQGGGVETRSCGAAASPRLETDPATGCGVGIRTDAVRAAFHSARKTGAVECSLIGRVCWRLRWLASCGR